MKKLGVGLLLLNIAGSFTLILLFEIEPIKVIYLSAIVATCSLLILVSDRIVTVRYKNLEIKTVTDKAISDAKRIESIYADVRSQKEALDMIMRDANSTQAEVRSQKELLDTIVNSANNTQSEILRMKEEMSKSYEGIKNAVEIAKDAEAQAKKAKKEAVEEMFEGLDRALRDI